MNGSSALLTLYDRGLFAERENDQEPGETPEPHRLRRVRKPETNVDSLLSSTNMMLIARRSPRAMQRAPHLGHFRRSIPSWVPNACQKCHAAPLLLYLNVRSCISAEMEGCLVFEKITFPRGGIHTGVTQNIYA